MSVCVLLCVCMCAPVCMYVCSCVCMCAPVCVCVVYVSVCMDACVQTVQPSSDNVAETCNSLFVTTRVKRMLTDCLQNRYS